MVVVPWARVPADHKWLCGQSQQATWSMWATNIMFVGLQDSIWKVTHKLDVGIWYVWLYCVNPNCSFFTILEQSGEVWCWAIVVGWLVGRGPHFRTICLMTYETWTKNTDLQLAKEALTRSTKQKCWCYLGTVTFTHVKTYVYFSNVVTSEPFDLSLYTHVKLVPHIKSFHNC
jgi:hypothetical protein